MTPDPQTATKAFLEMVVLLGKMLGITGIPLAYVVRFIPKSPNNLNYDDLIRDQRLSPFWPTGESLFLS